MKGVGGVPHSIFVLPTSFLQTHPDDCFRTLYNNNNAAARATSGPPAIQYHNPPTRPEPAASSNSMSIIATIKMPALLRKHRTTIVHIAVLRTS